MTKDFMDKPSLRRDLLVKRASLATTDWKARSGVICRLLADWITEKGFPAVFFYASHRGEPDLKGLIDLLPPSISFALPRAHADRTMSFHEIKSFDELQAGNFGILEPLASAPVRTPTSQDVILAPCVAIDKEGYRLGYGGGYYDRLLAQHHHPNTVGVAFHEFILPAVPHGTHDQALFWLATEKGIYRTGRGSTQVI